MRISKENEMKKLMVRFQTFAMGIQRSNDEGAVAAEYGVLLAGIVAVVAIAATALGGRIGRLFDAIVP
jgi:Flp pilus assembly pilin Flp